MWLRRPNHLRSDGGSQISGKQEMNSKGDANTTLEEPLVGKLETDDFATQVGNSHLKARLANFFTFLLAHLDRHGRIPPGPAELGCESAAKFGGSVNMNERWLSVAEIAAHLGVNPDTIYKWIDRKGLPAHKVGRLWKFRVSEVDAWVEAGKAGKS